MVLPPALCHFGDEEVRRKFFRLFLFTDMSPCMLLCMVLLCFCLVLLDIFLFVLLFGPCLPSQPIKLPLCVYISTSLCIS